MTFSGDDEVPGGQAKPAGNGFSHKEYSNLPHPVQAVFECHSCLNYQTNKALLLLGTLCLRSYRAGEADESCSLVFLKEGPEAGDFLG